MKFRHKLCYQMIVMVLIFFSCKKSEISKPNEVVPDIKGSWKLNYHVVANIFIGQSIRNDTIYARHGETWIYKTDSVTTDSWLTTNYDQTKTPPVFTVSDTVQFKGTYAYTLNGMRLIQRINNRLDTFDVVTLSNSELLLHSKSQPRFGFNDLYHKLSR
jgi:hypothetical protein